MRTLLPFGVLLATLIAVSPAQANSTCTSVLTADQLRDLNAMLIRTHPFNPHLTDAVAGDQAQGAVSRLSRKNVEAMRGAFSHPYSAVIGGTREDFDAALKSWLRANSSGQLPAWDINAGDDLSTPAWVPRVWIGQTVEGYIDLLKTNGNAGPLKPSMLGAPTSRGRELGVTRFVATDKSGHDKFMWAHIYRATVNGRLLTTLLSMCEADIVVMSEDEVDLRQKEQQLSKAWPTRDRLTVERILASEWSVTADGTTVSRSALIDATFESKSRLVENMDTNDDEVTVMQFGTAAVVRGHTLSTVVLSGARQFNNVRFTDVFIKRGESWQMVASHVSNIPP